MKTFYKLLANTGLATVTDNFVWFAATFWIYLETRSILATSILGGSYMLLSAILGLFFGTFVDHHKKKFAMQLASASSLAGFSLAALMYITVPHDTLLQLDAPLFWIFVLFILAGALAGNMRGIALSTTVTLLVDEKHRDKANGLVGSVNGLAFAITSVFSGLVVGFLGMGWALAIAVALTAGILAHLFTIRMQEPKPDHTDTDGPVKRIDVRGALDTIHKVPGLLALIFFATFNNFLGGVFMSLLDPYGLNLMSVEAWGILWGVACTGFIFGGLIVAKRGLGASPLRALFLANIAMWVVCFVFPIKSIIPFLAVGMFAYMLLIPAVEAAEQTIIQKVVPAKRQGRVFGFAQSIESAASPITAFLIGPLAQLWVVPFMTTGWGAQHMGSWFGTGEVRAIALIFMATCVIGLIVTILAMSSRSYKILSKAYGGHKSVKVPNEVLAQVSPLD